MINEIEKEINPQTLYIIRRHLILEEEVLKSRKKIYGLIKELVKAGISQKKLALYCKVSQQRINQIIHEHGHFNST